jgi:hypothetical protein
MRSLELDVEVHSSYYTCEVTQEMDRWEKCKGMPEWAGAGEHDWLYGAVLRGMQHG